MAPKTKLKRVAPRSPKSILQIEGASRALQLRKRGYSMSEIADEMLIPTSTAAKLVKTGLSHIETDLSESAVEARRLELERLDELIKLANSELKYNCEVPSETFKGIETINKLITQKASLLGLNAPSKLDVSTPQSRREYIGIDTDKV